MGKLNWDYYGHDIADTSNPPRVDSYEACASLCYLTTSQCQSFSWSPGSKKCHLKGGFPQNSGSNSEVHSGMRGNQSCLKVSFCNKL